MVSYIIISIVGVLMIVLDQWTKAIIAANVTTEIPVIENFFDIVHWHNTGAAFGIFSNNTKILGAISFIMAAVIIFVYAQTSSKFLKLCLSLLIAGAIGNAIDRWRLGYVIDFLSFDNLFGYEFPAFNVADICVTSACIGLAIYLIFLSSKARAFREGTLMDKLFMKESKKAENKEENE